LCEVNDHHFKRLKGTDKWTEYIPEHEHTTLPATDSDPLYLYLIHENQGPGEPRHWSLFLARENQQGWVYQVTGDAEFMTYEPSAEMVDATSTEEFYSAYQLATVTEDQVVVIKQVCESEAPLSAPNRRLVRDNCQGWAVRVVARLVGEGVVGESKLRMMRGMVEPVGGGIL
ncbi:hypothetical protein BO71DRAFT_326666, partial [Aspergillus ellipticus CBS 707.79]